MPMPEKKNKEQYITALKKANQNKIRSSFQETNYPIILHSVYIWATFWKHKYPVLLKTAYNA
jgi:hypothetical protein